MSSRTSDLLPSPTALFYDRNNLHIYINDKFFGETTHPSLQITAHQTILRLSTGPNVTWGNLCACMATLIDLDDDYNRLFQPNQPAPDESIPWDLQSRQPFGNCKAYDFLGVCVPRQYSNRSKPVVQSQFRESLLNILDRELTNATNQKQGGHALPDIITD
jgi:hypothetical protein